MKVRLLAILSVTLMLLVVAAAPAQATVRQQSCISGSNMTQVRLHYRVSGSTRYIYRIEARTNYSTGGSVFVDGTNKDMAPSFGPTALNVWNQYGVSPEMTAKSTIFVRLKIGRPAFYTCNVNVPLA